jgi:hypothetical protein
MSAPVVDITARLHAERDELRDRVAALEFELALTNHITATMFHPNVTEPNAAEAMLSVVPSQLIRALRKGTPTVRLNIGGRNTTVTLTPGHATAEEIVAAWIGLLETHRAISAQAPAGTVFVTRAVLPAQILRAEWGNPTGDRVVVTALTPVTSTPTTPTRPQRRLRVVAPLAEETL